MGEIMDGEIDLLSPVLSEPTLSSRLGSLIGMLFEV